MRRKIAIFTGNRSEYGLQYSIIKAIAKHPNLSYHLLVSGAHLNEDFGRTVREIRRDGFRVTRQIKIDLPEDSLYGTAMAIGSGVASMSRVLKGLKPDILVVFGDRFEGFSAVIAGSQMGIPTAHIEGGDITEGGALDDGVRHAMTKLAHYHFTTNADAARRVKALGEESWRVFNVGFPAIDLVASGAYAKPNEIADDLKLDLRRPFILFTQHSVTTEFVSVEKQIRPSLAALETLAREDDCQILATYPNNDAGGKKIIRVLRSWADKNSTRVQLHKSLGRYNYLGVLNCAGRGGAVGVCVGNSSSGIKETPVFGCPAVNIGTRQEGRLRSTNVLEAGYSKDEILSAVRRSLFDKAYRKQCLKCKNPYGSGQTGRLMAEILSGLPLGLKALKKRITI